MIFKNEGAPRIQRITSDVGPRNEADPGQPFEYRKELTESIKKKLYAALEGRSGNATTSSSYARLAGTMKAIGLPLPPGTDANLLVMDRMSTLMDDWSLQFDSTTAMLKTFALLSTSEIVKHPNYPEFLKALQRKAENGSLSFDGCVLLRLLAPQTPRAQFSVRQLDNLQKMTPATAHRRARAMLTAFEGIATAKMSGAFRGSPLNAEDWRSIRDFYDKCLKADNMVDVARIAFYSRVLNAADIRFDENGLHIIDPEIEATLPSSTYKTMPERRNI